jgi:NitT/TauT family transport system permease protein
MKDSSANNRVISGTVVIVLILVWELIARITGSRQILPGPVESFTTLIKLIGAPSFFPSLGSTLLRGILGFILSFGAALLVGILSGISRKTEAGFRPVIITLRSTPVISFILLALIWFRVDQVPVFIGFLTMFPILSTNITQGIRSTDHGLIEMARIYEVSDIRILRDIYIPSILPFLFSGASTATGFGWRSIIIGEVLSQPRYGIGAMMQDSQSFLLVAEVVAWTLIAVVFGAFFEWLIRITEKRIMKWNR